MTHWRFVRMVRHPLVAGVIAVFIFPITAKLTTNAVYVAELFAAADDPPKIADLRLERHLDRETAEHEIRLALADRNSDLAQSFVEVSKDLHLPIDSRLLDQVKEASVDQQSVGSTVSGFFRGFLTGEARDSAALAGSAVSDVVFFGDARDLAKETVHFATGQPYDAWVLGMSAAGVAATAGTYFAGAGLPERVGLSFAKIARRSDRLNLALALRISKMAEDGTVVEIADTAASIERRAGVQATLDSLALAEDPEDLTRIERLATTKGTRTAAILKLLGRTAYRAGVGGWVLAKWVAIGTLATGSFLFWAMTALLGIVGWCKSLASRVVRFFFPSRPNASLA